MSKLMKQKSLKSGGLIAIVSPSGSISENIVSTAVPLIEAAGYRVEVMPNVLGHSTGVFSGTDRERANDLREAIIRDDIGAIICARGGYGAVRTIQTLGNDVMRWCDKWMVGFSDITAIHSSLSRFGWSSLHAPMLKRIAEAGMQSEDVAKTFAVMRGENLTVRCKALPGSRDGSCEAVVTGGNLSLIYSLRSTPSDICPDGKILFIEDLCEYNYHVDRMMQNLRYSGVLERINGLIVGHLTDMKDGATPYGKDAAEIIAEAVAPYGYPVLIGYPAGHGDGMNMPLVLGSKARLVVENGEAMVEWLAADYR